MNIFQENFYEKIVLLVKDINNIIKIEYETANITFSGDFLIINKFNPEDNSVESIPYNLKNIDKYKTF